MNYMEKLYSRQKKDEFNDNSIAAGFIHWDKLETKYAAKKVWRVDDYIRQIMTVY